MNLDFNIENVIATEFGVGRDQVGKQAFNTVPVNNEVQTRPCGPGRVSQCRNFNTVPANNGVQTALHDMLTATVDAQKKISKEPRQYDPSEKFGGIGYLYLSLHDERVELFRHLHKAQNIDTDTNALNNMDCIFCYFSRFTDNAHRTLTALRHPTQFKSLGKSRGLMQFVGDTLTLIQNPLFKLDKDFDLLIDSTQVHIFRVSGFEFIGKLQAAIREAVPQNIKAIQSDIPYVNWEPIEQYATSHTRAARYLASIQSQGWAQQVDKFALKDLCQNTGVGITVSDGRLNISKDQVLGFLEVLDRRRYEIELVSDTPEHFRAAAREQLSTQGPS